MLPMLVLVSSVCLCLVYSLHRFAGTGWRHVAHKQAVHDGAVVASLLELGSVPDVGDEWWLLGSGANGTGEKWYRGCVTEVTRGDGGVFVVELDNPEEVERDGGIVAAPARIPTAPPRELVRHARGLTRWIPFEDITGPLLRGSAGSADDYAMSRPLKAGGKIDWFISHSWHDDAPAKFAELSRLAGLFKQEHGRYPRVWLDKVCINQANVEEALKCLPVFLQSCDQVVALVGPTYFGRLWCVWELYVRVVFSTSQMPRSDDRDSDSDSDSGSAAEGDCSADRSTNSDGGPVEANVLFSTLRGMGGIATLHRLISGFKLSSAACFDPNEQNKLLRAIAAADGGAAAFENAVRDMASFLPASLATD